MIHLARAGETGPLVLLLHGIGGSSASFQPQLDGLPADHRVLAWDAPGYGGSPDPEAAPGISGYAAAAAEVLASHLGGHVVGVSWGGVIATRLAAEHPELVRSLVLADSSRGSGVSAESAARMRARADELASLGAAEFARRRAPRLVSPAAAPELVARITEIMAGVRLPGYRFAAESMAATDHTSILPALRMPTLVLVGADDQVTGVAESRRLGEAIPGARLEIISGAGHAANQERPEEFNRLLTAFLASVDAGLGVRS